MRKYLHTRASAPALTSDDGRPVAIVHGVERALAGVRLEWTVSDNRQMVHLTQRDAWVAQGDGNGGLRFICNNDERFPVMVSGFGASAIRGQGGCALLEVLVEAPQDGAGITAAADVLEGLAESARAFWGYVSPEDHGLVTAQQYRHPGDPPHVPPKGLPPLKLSWDIPSPEIPAKLGWLNYWPDASARVIGFPDPARDADLLSRARRTATGGWIVRLTDEPLDLDDPAHLDALLRAYERFPVIGGRSAPTRGPAEPS